MSWKSLMSWMNRSASSNRNTSDSLRAFEHAHTRAAGLHWEPDAGLAGFVRSTDDLPMSQLLPRGSLAKHCQEAIGDARNLTHVAAQE